MQMGFRLAAAAGEQMYFATLTSHEKLKTWEACERVWRSAWNALYGALKRVTENFRYVMVPERHADGRLHMHAIWNASVSKRWLKDNARRRGMGHQADAGAIPDEMACMRYVTKYLGKNLGEEYPKRFRRVRASRNWPDIPPAQTPENGLDWEYVGTNGALQIVYEECQAKGIALIDRDTGAYFDDIDLGTIVAE